MSAPKGNTFGRRENKWSNSEDVLMAEAFESRLSVEEVAELLGRTPKSIELRCYRVRSGSVKKYSRKARKALQDLHAEGVSMRVKPQKKSLQDKADALKEARPTKKTQAPEENMSRLWIGFVAGIAFAGSVFAILEVYSG